MAPLKRIIVEVQGTANASLTHQVRNFGEDLWRLLEQSGLADLGGLEEIDRVTDKIEMRIHHSRKISTVRRIVQAELRRHFLEDRTLVHWS